MSGKTSTHVAMGDMTMRKVTVKRNQCGHEERIELYSREEAEKERIRIVPFTVFQVRQSERQNTRVERYQ
jgi:hypothetical protein